MELEKGVEIKGLRAVKRLHRKTKKDKLITLWVSGELRDNAYKACPNVSGFLRLCLERLVASSIDKQVHRLYDTLAKDIVDSQLDDPDDECPTS